ncbi:MAG: hypothetical protein NTZ50_05820 [Chloroflexi bacterium]|nr:hypothetical protein [Chloroflexota bacterium]
MMNNKAIRLLPLFVSVFATVAVTGVVTAQTKTTPTPQVQRTAAAVTATAAAARRVATATAKSMTATSAAKVRATSMAATAAVKSATATAAAEFRSATATTVAESRAATAEAKAADATATAEVRDAEINLFARYLPIDMKRLLDYPGNFTSDLVVVRGRIFNIVKGSNDTFQMYAAGTYDALLIQTENAFDDLFENDNVIVYGEVEGESCFNNSMGNEVCQPKIRLASVFKQETQAMRLARGTAVAEQAVIERERVAAEAIERAATRATAAAESAQYEYIADRDLSTYPKNYTGVKVRVRARVFNIVENAAVIQANLLGNGEPIYVEAAMAFDGIYDGDVVEVFGEVEGVKCFTNRMGAEVCHPHISGAKIVK